MAQGLASAVELLSEAQRRGRTAPLMRIAGFGLDELDASGFKRLHDTAYVLFVEYGHWDQREFLCRSWASVAVVDAVDDGSASAPVHPPTNLPWRTYRILGPPGPENFIRVGGEPPRPSGADGEQNEVDAALRLGRRLLSYEGLLTYIVVPVALSRPSP